MGNAASFTKPTSNITWQYFSQTLEPLTRTADVLRCYVHVFEPRLPVKIIYPQKMGTAEQNSHCVCRCVREARCLPMTLSVRRSVNSCPQNERCKRAASSTEFGRLIRKFEEGANDEPTYTKNFNFRCGPGRLVLARNGISTGRLRSLWSQSRLLRSLRRTLCSRFNSSSGPARQRVRKRR